MEPPAGGGIDNWRVFAEGVFLAALTGPKDADELASGLREAAAAAAEGGYRRLIIDLSRVEPDAAAQAGAIEPYIYAAAAAGEGGAEAAAVYCDIGGAPVTAMVQALRQAGVAAREVRRIDEARAWLAAFDPPAPANDV